MFIQNTCKCNYKTNKGDKRKQKKRLILRLFLEFY